MSKRIIVNEEVKEKGKQGLSEFKKFISKGNVIDMAVGVIIGGAFGSIVSSLVDDILMPLIGVIIGGIDFSGLSIKVGGAAIKYGMFIQNVIDFLIVAFCVFMIVKFLEKFKKKEEEKPVAKSDEVKLLEEIRDLLKTNKK